MSKKNKKVKLTKSLISILINEHRNRRNMLFTTLEGIKQRIEESEDEMDINMNVDYLNDIIKSSINNDKNIVDLIELLLKYDYDDGDIEELKRYKNKLSDNKLDINFDK